MLIINEIFYSIQGETSFAGLPCVFVRLTGCNLRCAYCDTTYALEEGIPLNLHDIVQKVQRYSCHLVEITGGEPLFQSETPELAAALIKKGHTILLETNGSMDIDLMPAPVVRIVDIKCPGSGFVNRNDWKNLERLRPADEVKFVILNKADFEWAVGVIRRHDLIKKAGILFSPVFHSLNPQTLTEWILQERLPVRLQVQLHKILWPGQERGK